MKRFLLIATCAGLLLPFAQVARATDWWNVGDIPYGDGRLCRRYPTIEQTIKNCELLLKLGHHFKDQKVPWALDEIADYYADLKQFDSAILLEERALEMDPSDAAYYASGIASYYGAEGRPAHAISYLNGAIAKYGKNLRLLASRCWQRAALGEQLQFAKEDCEAAIAMNTGESYPQSARGLVNFKLGKYEDAIKDCNVGLAAYPRYAGGLYLRGLSKLKLSDTAGGNADIAAAKAILPDIAETFAIFGVTR